MALLIEPEVKARASQGRWRGGECGAEGCQSFAQVVQKGSSVGESLAIWLASAAAGSVKERGAFTVAFAGGSLPSLLEPLRLRKDVEWEKWHVFTVDERCLPHRRAAVQWHAANSTQLPADSRQHPTTPPRSNDESNVKALRRVLLQKPETALPPGQVRVLHPTAADGTPLFRIR